MNNIGRGTISGHAESRDLVSMSSSKTWGEKACEVGATVTSVGVFVHVFDETEHYISISRVATPDELAEVQLWQDGGCVWDAPYTLWAVDADSTDERPAHSPERRDELPVIRWACGVWSYAKVLAYERSFPAYAVVTVGASFSKPLRCRAFHTFASALEAYRTADYATVRILGCDSIGEARAANVSSQHPVLRGC